MANRDTNRTLNYWFEGASTSLIKGNKNIIVGQQAYWFNGSADGYLAGSSSKPKPRYFAILIGF